MDRTPAAEPLAGLVETVLEWDISPAVSNRDRAVHLTVEFA